MVARGVLLPLVPAEQLVKATRNLQQDRSIGDLGVLALLTTNVHPLINLQGPLILFLTFFIFARILVGSCQVTIPILVARGSLDFHVSVLPQGISFDFGALVCVNETGRYLPLKHVPLVSAKFEK